jgi:hypothetical protein
MRWLIVPALAVTAASLAVPAQARTTSASCQSEIHRLEAMHMRSQAAAEEVGKARSYLEHGNARLCLQHANRARRIELGVAEGSSTPPRRSRVYRDSEAGATAELNRRELRRNEEYR